MMVAGQLFAQYSVRAYLNDGPTRPGGAGIPHSFVTNVVVPSRYGQPKLSPPVEVTLTSSNWSNPTSAMNRRPVGLSIEKRNGFLRPTSHTRRRLMFALVTHGLPAAASNGLLGGPGVSGKPRTSSRRMTPFSLVVSVAVQAIASSPRLT